MTDLPKQPDQARSPSSFSELLDLEELAADLFVGHSPQMGRTRVYGGQVVAQALMAAQRTNAADHTVHSLHGYFIRAGDETKPIVFDVDRIRDGRSFSTRRVVARQAGGAIFNLSASFHRDEPDAEVDGTTPGLDTPGPDDCINDEWDRISDVREVPDELLKPGQTKAWVRVRRMGDVSAIDSVANIAVAYCSDHIPMGAIRRAHPSGADWEEFMGASLDHSIWFHRSPEPDEWLLYDMHLQALRGSRGVAHGTVHNRQGELIATVAQEGLLRPVKK